MTPVHRDVQQKAKGTSPVLSVRDLRLSFPVEVTSKENSEQQPRSAVEILRGVEFDLNAGESLGIIGESGCGKSLTGLSLMGLQPQSATVSGKAFFDEQDLLGLSERDIAPLRGAELAMVFQEPMTALNPVHTVGAQMDEVLRIHTNLGRRERRQRIEDLMDQVKLDRQRASYSAYPHMLSGGQRQRVVVAMALAANPSVLIADEPTTALDVSVQAEILDLFDELVVMQGRSLILITHDLGVVARACDRVLVMYSGAIVEAGPVEQILRTPKHPYTQALMKSLPGRAETKGQRLFTIPGRVPNPLDRPQGCAFAPRCDFASKICQKPPELEGDFGHQRVACWHPRLALGGNAS